MNSLRLVKSENFGTVQADIYSNGNDMFMTINQLAECLEYASIAGVTNIISRNEYLSNQDFSVTHRLCATDGKHYDTRIFTEDGIYEITMLSSQPKAKEFRAWIRRVLKGIRSGAVRLQGMPQTLPEALRLAADLADKAITLQGQIAEQRPKVLFADSVETAQNSMLIGDLAKIIRQNGVEMGQNRLFDWLRDNSFLCKFGERYNAPTQSAMDMGLFEVKVRTINNPDGSIRTTKTTKVTGKGQIYFVNKFVGAGFALAR